MPQRLSQAIAGRYRIERTLGRGGMATVYLAEDLRHHRPVAIKVLDPEVAAAIGPERFLREIEIVARLRHPHILPLFDSGAADGLLFYVMPFVEGESLRQRLDREKQLPIAEAARIAREVADALDHAHRHGFVHRDVKPENVLLEEGHAVVADFGIARALTATGRQRLTVSGVTVGTPAYTSPEQAAGRGDVDGRSDQYALGCVLYEMLAGVPPFAAATEESLVYQHLNVAPRPVTELRTAVPAAIARTIATALAKTPADRFATIAEFAAALTPAGAEAPPAPTRRRGRAIAATAAAVAIAGVGLAAWQEWWPFGGGPAAPPARKEWILVADFDGPPGDSTLAPTARSLLSAALDQSRSVATVPPDQIRAALAAAGKPRDARLDRDLARELAYRSSVRAVLEGTIGRLGKGYSIVLTVSDADTPRVILTRSGTAKDEDALIPALGRMAQQLRAGLGENRAALSATRPMTLVATPSFEAYRLYAQGRYRYNARTSNRELIRSCRTALALDSNFAMAWFAMAGPYINLGYPDSARSCLEQALRRPDRLTPGQLEWIEIMRASLDGDLLAAAAGYDRLVADDPGDLSALASGNDALLAVGRIEEALERTRKVIMLSPFPVPWRINEVADLIYLGRFDEAREANRKNTTTWREWQQVQIEAAEERWAVAESLASTARPLADVPEGFQGFIAAARFARGSVALADAGWQHAEELARAASDPASVTIYRRHRIARCQMSGAVLALAPDTWARDTTTATLLTRGLRAAVAGDPVLARRCLEAARHRPPRELVPEGDTPALLEAQIELLARRPEAAVRLLRPAAVRRAVYDSGVRPLWVRWVIADAFERLGQPDSAAFYLERTFTVPFQSEDATPFAHRRLALLYARLGRIPEAERHLAAAERAWDRPDPPVRRMLDEARAAVAAARGMARPSPERSPS